MKKSVLILLFFASIVSGCLVSKNGLPGKNGADASPIKNDTIRIANEKLEYEVVIIDPGFSSWFNSYAKPRNFYSQSYLETRNRVWVTEWNIRAQNPTRYSSNLYEMQIDYQYNIDYGYEVNYMLYNYLTYFQITNKTKLGSFEPRI